MARQPLGRGLSALLGEDKPEVAATATAPAGESNVEIDIDLIDPNPEQPRTRFAEENLDELAASIRANGVVQPIVLRHKGERYEIVAGERRWRASQKAELRRIPAVVREVSDEKMLELALVENIQRQELNPIEEARAYKRLIDTLGLLQEEVADRVGKSRTVVTTSMRLLRLPGEIQRHLEDGKLSAGHGRALLTTDDPSLQRTIAQEIIDKGLSVREAERAAKRGKGRSQPSENKGVTATTDPNVKAAETKLIRRFNTNVKIRPANSGKGGKIEIEYYGVEDLNRIYELLMDKE
ncbi:MAG TPA: ParB/RepB/Spo0J family partition protein [Pyrinomonadaceae bacterium]|nr:ParB/RepB/Spo0J family partition protein [Pyrinomonadaceae bacterium]